MHIIINTQTTDKNEKFRRIFSVNYRISKHVEVIASSSASAFRHTLSARKGHTHSGDTWWPFSETGLGKETHVASIWSFLPLVGCFQCGRLGVIPDTTGKYRTTDANAGEMAPQAIREP